MSSSPRRCEPRAARNRSTTFRGFHGHTPPNVSHCGALYMAGSKDDHATIIRKLRTNTIMESLMTLSSDQNITETKESAEKKS